MIGLGNPGTKYAGTRHNAGFEVADALSARWELPRAKKRYGGLIADGRTRPGGPRVSILLPQTFMNDSGEAVAPLVRRFGIDDLTHLVIVHDELDLPVGRVKVKSGGGLAGHNGLRSIQAQLHSADFVRVRIGVGKPPSKEVGADHVLRKPSKRDREELDIAVVEAADAVELLVTDGIEAAMDACNN